MTTIGDMLFQLGGVPALPGIPFGPKAKYYFVDPVNGVSTNNGEDLTQALTTLQGGEDKTTGDQHDTVFFIAGDTGANITASIAWDKDYTHAVGIGCGLPGMGQRCRVVAPASVDATEVIAVSGNGCCFANLQFYNGGDTDAEAAAAVVSGSRNHFKNVFFAGMGHATSAAHVGGCSLQVTGDENYFEDCTIGLDTIVRGAANYQLKISGKRNHFKNCKIISNCVTAGAFMVQIDNSAADLRWNLFEDCLFYNYRENWGTAITDCFDMPAGGLTHDVILKGNCMLYGCTGWADTVTHLIHMLAAPATGGGIGIAVNA